jgi:hypothetical protein
MELGAIEEKIVDVQERYWDAEDDLRNLYKQRAEILCPFLVGDVLHGNRYSDGKKKDCIVLKIGYTWPTGTLEVVVTDIKKDGGLSARAYKLHDGELSDDHFKKKGHRDLVGCGHVECMVAGSCPGHET